MSLREISFILVSPFDLEARYYYINICAVNRVI